jgi:hypothetical protein
VTTRAPTIRVTASRINHVVVGVVDEEVATATGEELLHPRVAS